MNIQQRGFSSTAKRYGKEMTLEYHVEKPNKCLRNFTTIIYPGKILAHVHQEIGLRMFTSMRLVRAIKQENLFVCMKTEKEKKL